MKRVDQKGFTIIELLIATVVFSVILLVITAAIVQFGRVYYKGTLQVRTQETTRNIVQDVAQSIQFGSGLPTTGTSPTDTTLQFICISDRRYTFKLNAQLGPSAGQSRHVVVTDDVIGGCNSVYANMATPALPAGARELMGDRMQLVELSVQNVGTGLWRITARTAYGSDSDLSADKRSCQLNLVGGQFCAVSELSTIVKQRL